MTQLFRGSHKVREGEGCAQQDDFTDTACKSEWLWTMEALTPRETAARFSKASLLLDRHSAEKCVHHSSKPTLNDGPHTPITHPKKSQLPSKRHGGSCMCKCTQMCVAACRNIRPETTWPQSTKRLISTESSDLVRNGHVYKGRREKDLPPIWGSVEASEIRCRRNPADYELLISDEAKS